MVVILGGGVAGMSCGLWLKQLGFTPIIVEKNTKLGGQLLAMNRVNRWVLGSPGKTSVELAKVYSAHIKKENIDIYYQASLIKVSANLSGYTVSIDVAGKIREFSVLAIVIASGLRVKGEEVLGPVSGFKSIYENRMISFFPLDHLAQLPKLKDKTIAVIGGGDNAHFTAKDIAQAGAKVYLVMRSHQKAHTMVRQEIEPLIKQGLIIVLAESQLVAFRKDKGQAEITLLRGDGGGDKILVDMIFARFGFSANSEFMNAFEAFSDIKKHVDGYLGTDSAKRTSLPWVYAIGDVANRNYQSVVNAISDGAIAAKDLSERI